MGSYSRQDVLRILDISSRQLQGWERSGIIPQQQRYTFQDLGQLRTLRALREEAVPAASIRQSIQAMKAVSGMAYPLLEASVVRTGARLAFRHRGAMVDPIRRQLLFDFERADRVDRPMTPKKITAGPAGLQTAPGPGRQGVQKLFLAAVEAEECGKKHQALKLYEELLALEPAHAAACINVGTLYFHLRDFARAEGFYRRAVESDPAYALGYFDLGNVLDELERQEESITAYRQAVALAPGYADAHYNLALAYERTGEYRPALRHWQAYVKIDKSGPWAEHARGQIRKLLSREPLAIAWRAEHFVPRGRKRAKLALV